MNDKVIKSFKLLRDYCEKEDYKGWDPYDGLNSKLFQRIPFIKNSSICRLIMIQAMKRCPINLRHILFIEKEWNPKGIALFLSGYCNLYNIVNKDSNKELIFGTKEELISIITRLANILIQLKSKGNYHGSCWGYNFDWQARRLFLFPKYTPTVVATNFCANALFDAFEITGNELFFKHAISSAEFITKDLHQTTYKGGIILSYSPLSGNDTVFNASLLGSKLLARCYSYSKNDTYLILAEKSVKACCKGQNQDGSWIYGMLPVQSWIDSFHTGYNIDALHSFKHFTNIGSYDKYITNGFDYYVNIFFKSNGEPKYYNDKTYPIDIHCPAQFIITLSQLNKLTEHREIAERVLDWTIKNMQSPDGYFYYQIKKFISSKISYMRWSNAFMFNAFTHYFKNTL